MAAISGDQKQKLFVLAGFLGVLVLVGYFVLGSRSKPDESAATGSVVAGAPAVSGAPKPVAAKPAATKEPVKLAKAPEKKPAKAAPVKVLLVETAPLAKSRPDPFEPFYLATPEPTATPTPLPPPVQLPDPPSVPLPSPRLTNAPPSSVLIGLPRPRIAGYAPLPGPLWWGRGTPAKAPDAQIRAANKRLSGVIIGDSVRALLEITTPDAGAGAGAGGGEGGAGAAATTTVVRVVQPGDEVDGIRILRIERVYENGRQITRMFVKEGNEERYIDLRPSPTPPAATGVGGAPGEGGAPGAPFGAIRPAGPGGFQRGGRNPNPLP